jgi:antagonist of KipI
MDWFAFCAANRLAGNPEFAPGLEVGMPGCRLVVMEDQVVSAAGNGYAVFLDGIELPMWMSFLVRAGQSVELISNSEGGWGYLAFHGGIAAQPVLNSCSTFIKGKIGGMNGTRIQDGDYLTVRKGVGEIPLSLVGRNLDEMARLPYVRDPILRVIPGPQVDRFSLESQAEFFRSIYKITFQSDRMGYRLEGERLIFQLTKELLSEGMVPGSIQVPTDGQPIVMMSDSPTSGGYAKIAGVITADLPLIAQAVPGISTVRFLPIEVEEAQAEYRKLRRRLEEGIQDDLDIGGSTWGSI